MGDVSLDWSSAEVHDGKLDVALRGEPPAGWKDGFKRTLALLPGGEWGEVRLKKDRIQVGRVAEGGEDRLRHFLESVVLQANANAEPEDTETDDDGDAEDDEFSGPDGAMTQRFRSFATDTEEPES